ncbi:hypothetical protein LOAG_04795 [Loa loa]|uniref:Uncharacterized protein n=1 Tax=Loa loa TaxID=7209 RepID=A0A1S0U143_LOALO|nr:hypothetical protein LOAG_04795 [Loa loa]EFO23692.1 hypothetical protein LOAG_04795 [Loa loa]
MNSVEPILTPFPYQQIGDTGENVKVDLCKKEKYRLRLHFVLFALKKPQSKKIKMILITISSSLTNVLDENNCLDNAFITVWPQRSRSFTSKVRVQQITTDSKGELQ